MIGTAKGGGGAGCGCAQHVYPWIAPRHHALGRLGADFDLAGALGASAGIGNLPYQASGGAKLCIAKELIEYTREKAGADAVNEALKDIPGIDMVL